MRGTLALWLLALPGALHAQTRVVQVDSRILGEARTLHVYLPPNYKLARQRYPVVLLLDGQVRAFFELAVAVTAYDLTGDQRDYAMPAQIVVGVEQGDRGADLLRNGALFRRFLTEELLPYLDRNYRTLPFRTLVGHSLGGRFVLETLCSAPAHFSAYVAISPSLSDSLLTRVKQCVTAAPVSANGPQGAAGIRQLVVSVGEREPRMQNATDKLVTFMRDSAATHGARPLWRILQVPGTELGHTDTPLATIPPALRFVFHRDVWEMPVAQADSMLAHQGDVDAILHRHIGRLREIVGFDVPPSRKWLEVVAGTYLARGDPPAALSAAHRLIDAYPESVSGYTLLADAMVLRRDNASARAAVQRAIDVLDKIEIFDETQRQTQRISLQRAMAGIPP